MFSPVKISNHLGCNLADRRITQAVVLAAGEGSRLRPLTIEKPKPMLDIAGQPLLARILSWLRSYDVSNVIINLHYKPEVITNYFGSGADWNLQITYSHENSILGTAGALKHCEAFLHPTFYLIYGDILTDFDLGRLTRRHCDAQKDGPRPMVSAGVYVVPNPTECGIVDLLENGQIKRIVEKPRQEEVFGNLALSGVFAMQKEVISEIPENAFYDVGYDLLPKLLAKGYPMTAVEKTDSEYLLDIGSPEKYMSACRDWAYR